MLASTQVQNFNHSHIRKLDLTRDLDQVADLIERCFPIHLDYDGQTYIKEMRKTAREMRLLGWLSNLAIPGSSLSTRFLISGSPVTAAGNCISTFHIPPPLQRLPSKPCAF